MGRRSAYGALNEKCNTICCCCLRTEHFGRITLICRLAPDTAMWSIFPWHTSHLAAAAAMMLFGLLVRASQRSPLVLAWPFGAPDLNTSSCCPAPGIVLCNIWALHILRLDGSPYRWYAPDSMQQADRATGISAPVQICTEEYCDVRPSGSTFKRPISTAERIETVRLPMT